MDEKSGQVHKIKVELKQLKCVSWNQ